MNAFLYIAIGIFVAAVVVLIVTMLMTWKSARQTQGRMADTMDGLKDQVEGLTTEANQLVNKANHLADDVNQKSAKLDVLVDGLKEVGVTLQSFNSTLRNFSAQMETPAVNKTEDASQVVKWGTVLMDLWQQKKK